MKSHRSLIQSLNKEQRRAVEEYEGPMVVIAGAGTGKTQMLSVRIMNMLLAEGSHIEPNMILALTYTDAGVVAMKKRLIEFMGPDAYKIPVHTFHSLCNEIVQSNMDYFGLRELEPASDIEILEVLRQCIRELGPDNPLFRGKGDQYFEVDRLRNLFRVMKEEHWSAEFIAERGQAYLQEVPTLPEFLYKRANAKEGIQVGDLKKKEYEKVTAQVNQLTAAAFQLEKYNYLLRKRNLYDFNDMITWVIDAFNDSEWLKITYQEKYQYILVDEMQDTNGSQIQLLKLLLDFYDTPNLFCVGDPRQCVYEFSGARMANIQEILESYEPSVITLVNNYRSNQYILDVAHKVINTGSTAGSAPLQASRPVSMGRPVVYEYANEFAEQSAVAFDIGEELNAGRKPEEIAVIYRKHRQGQVLLQQLMSMGIPVNVKRRMNVLEVPLIRNLITLMRSCEPLANVGGHFEVARMGFCGINQRSLESYMILSRINPDTEMPEDLKALSVKIWDTTNDFVNNPFIMTMETILYRFNVITWIQTQAEEVRKHPLSSVGSVIGTIDMMDEEGVSIPVLNLASTESGVNLLTCHGAKGLEFEKVYLIGCTANEWEASRAPNSSYFMPPTLYVNPEDKEEANRRLFYVGITRAKEALEISFAAQNNDFKDLVPSLFVTETGLAPLKQTRSLEEMDIILANSPTMDFWPSASSDIIGKKLEHFRLSVSSMNKYLKCQVAFYFEAFKEDMLKNRGSVMDDKFNRKMALLPLLERYWAERYLPSNKIVVTEYKVKNLVINGIPWEGDFDKLEFNGNLVDIVDYKTGRYNYIKAGLKPGGETWRQLVSYKIMLDLMTWTGWKFNSARIEMIDDDFLGAIPLEITPEDEATVRSDMATAYHGIMEQKFSKGCGDSECKWCNSIKQ